MTADTLTALKSAADVADVADAWVVSATGKVLRDARGMSVLLCI